jgi:hypothetical protein
MPAFTGDTTWTAYREYAGSEGRIDARTTDDSLAFQA